MRAIAWDERVLAALTSAKEAPVEQFENLSKMAVLLFHAEKQSKRRLTRTASACGWDHERTEGAVLAIAKILMDAAKAEWSDDEMQAGLASTLPVDHSKTLSKLYGNHRDMIALSVRRDTDLQISKYHSLDWRIDLELANRMTRNAPHPIVTLALHTTPPPVQATTGEQAEIARSDVPVQQQTTCLRVDYANLKKLQHQLEKALLAGDSVHVNRMHRYLR